MAIRNPQCSPKNSAKSWVKRLQFSQKVGLAGVGRAVFQLLSKMLKKSRQWTKQASTNRACITHLITVESFLKQGSGGDFHEDNFRMILCFLFLSRMPKTNQKNSALCQLGHRH